MSTILVLAEHEGGAFKKTAFELLGQASKLAGDLGASVAAVVLGDAPAASLGAYGASTVYQVAGDFSAYDSDTVVEALTAVLKQVNPVALLTPSSYVGKDAVPRLTARFGTGQASDITGLTVEGGALVARRPVYSGKAFVDVKISKTPAFYTVRPNSFGQPAAGSGDAAVTAVSFDAPAPRLTITERKAPESKSVDLTEADRIVSGGRSLGSKEKFDEVIRPLAAAIKATAGASRAAVDAGYAPHEDQVGQTGKVVNPSLYIATGISGAIQHLAGMRSSKVIVAINTDPEAPIFDHATYGIVGDLFEVAPLLTQEFNALD